MGRGFPNVLGDRDWWKTACQRRKVMPVFDEPGLMIHNKRVHAIGASIAKGALMSLASKEALAHTLFGNEDVVDIIVECLLEAPVLAWEGKAFNRTLLVLSTHESWKIAKPDGCVVKYQLILDVRPRMNTTNPRSMHTPSSPMACLRCQWCPS